MIWKLEHLRDMQKLPANIQLGITDKICSLLLTLDQEYGRDRNAASADGGYVLFASAGTSAEELKPFFDYTHMTPECIETIPLDGTADYVNALYLLNNEFGINVLLARKDAPQEILHELEAE